MTKKVIKKMLRFLELSREFQKYESDLFEERAEVDGGIFSGCSETITINTPDMIASGGAWICQSDPERKLKTRGEVILDQAKRKAKESDRYDEFISLRSELQEYLKATIKLS